MGSESKRVVIRLNNENKIEALLQETYDCACRQYNQIQDEINKIKNTTIVNNLDIDGKEKYAKVINNYLTLLSKVNGQKMDIAKLLSEIVKHSGNVGDALNNIDAKSSTLDIDKLRRLAISASEQNKGKEVYSIKK